MLNKSDNQLSLIQYVYCVSENEEKNSSFFLTYKVGKSQIQRHDTIYLKVFVAYDLFFRVLQNFFLYYEYLEKKCVVIYFMGYMTKTSPFFLLSLIVIVLRAYVNRGAICSYHNPCSF